MIFIPATLAAAAIGKAEFTNLQDAFNFELNREGRLVVTAHEPTSNRSIDVVIPIKQGISEEELEQAKARANRLVISERRAYK